jgi:hypothetical protein
MADASELHDENGRGRDGEGIGKSIPLISRVLRLEAVVAPM